MKDGRAIKSSLFSFYVLLTPSSQNLVLKMLLQLASVTYMIDLEALHVKHHKEAFFLITKLFKHVNWWTKVIFLAYYFHFPGI